MNNIKSNWRNITIILIVVCYIVFVFVMDKRTDLFLPVISIYLAVTVILFFDILVATPGIILHSFLHKEKPAIPFYKAAISLGTNNVNTLAAYGLILLRDFQPSEAKILFEKALIHSRHYMYNKTLTANIALCQWKEGDVAKGCKTYEDLFYFPDLERIEDFSDENLNTAVSLNHNFSAQDFTTMAFLMFKNNETEKATYFTKASLEKMTDYGPAYDNLGQIEYEKKNLEEAKAHFKKGLALKPDMSDSKYFLAKIAFDEKDFETSKKYLNDIDLSKINGLSTVTKDIVSSLQQHIETTV